MAASKIKASDRSKVCQQIVTILKKEYGSRAPSYEYNVLDTLLFSICLENSNASDAEKALQRLKDDFYDYNELRVSSITEIQNAFVDMSDPEWRAMRVREVLQFVFESGYTFDLEDLKKKTMDSAEKHLKKIKSLTPFSIAHTLLYALGSHIVPVSDSILSTAIWLGLLEPKTKIKTAAEQLKGAVRKSDVPLFYYLFSCLASDSKYQKIMESVPPADPETPLDSLKAVPDRLKALIAGKLKVPRKPAKTKTVKKKAAESKTSGNAQKPASKKATSKKKTATKKSSATTSGATKKKTATRKTTSKKATGKKATGGNKAVSNPPAKKKTSAKKTAGKKKTAVKKTAEKPKKKAVKKKTKTTKKPRK